MSLPRTAVGITAFMVFVGYLLSLVFKGKYTNPFVDQVTKSQQEIANAANGLNQTSGTYESITSVFSIVWNFLIMIINLIVGMFVSLAVFVSTMTLLPVEISGIIIALVSIGILFAILSRLIQI